jgi:hypothetical protein
LGISAAQQKEATRIFQAYYREYVALERRHTRHTRDRDGRVQVTIEPFADESLALVERLSAELAGVVDQRVAPQQPKKGEIHSQIGLFRHAGEATVKAELWREDRGNGQEYFYKESYQWLDGGDGMNAANGRSTGVFPEQYRLYWIDDASAAALPTGGKTSTDELAAAYRDAHNRRDVDAALKLFHYDGVPGFDAPLLRAEIARGFERAAKAVRFQFVPTDEPFGKLALPPKLIVVGVMHVELEDPVRALPAYTTGFRYLVGRLNGNYFLIAEALKGVDPPHPINPAPPTAAAPGSHDKSGG